MKWGWDYNRKEVHEVLAVNTGHELCGGAIVRVHLYKAMNGKILEVHTPQSNHRHADWDVEWMLIQDGDNLHEMVATLLLAKGIK